MCCLLIVSGLQAILPYGFLWASSFLNTFTRLPRLMATVRSSQLEPWQEPRERREGREGTSLQGQFPSAVWQLQQPPAPFSPPRTGLACLLSTNPVGCVPLPGPSISLPTASQRSLYQLAGVPHPHGDPSQ